MNEGMQAIVTAPGVPGALALLAVEAPAPRDDEALVRVEHTSINRGEAQVAPLAPPGLRFGWDVAGRIERAAADGSGPPEGTPVVGFTPMAGWAELAAVPTRHLAPLPPDAARAPAAALPTAGLTALRALELGGSVLGKTVLVTGSTGGVGHLAVQLARAAGAHVVAQVRRADGEAFARALGAHEVVAGDLAASGAGPFDLVLEGAGGAALAGALGLLAPGGAAVLYGAAGGAAPALDLTAFQVAGDTRLHGLMLLESLSRRPAGPDLARLVGLVGRGALRVHVGASLPWTEVGRAAADLLDRRFPGKAILSVSA